MELGRCAVVVSLLTNCEAENGILVIKAGELDVFGDAMKSERCDRVQTLDQVSAWGRFLCNFKDVQPDREFGIAITPVSAALAA